MDPGAAPHSPSRPSTTAAALPFSSPRSPPHSRRPRLGLLSRTLFHSPEVHFTFPLRIRAWAKQDVALVGDSFVHIKEVQSDGRLRHVASKADFPARIRAAQVIGSTTSDRVPNDLGDDDARQQHAHVLLLTLDSNDLAFLTMSTDASGADVFAASALPLAPQPSFLTEAGRHLVVDPFSRAVAAAAAVRTLEIFEMRPRPDWPAATAAAVAHRWILDTDMKIARLDFLYPPASRASSIYLLVVGYELKHGARADRLHARVYEWEHLSSEKPSVLPLTLPREFVKDHSIPLLLIPLRRFPGGFLLGCERRIAGYFDAHLGNIVLGRSQLSTESICAETIRERQENIGTSLSMPLWKAWASPLRNDLLVNNQNQRLALTTEHLYIAREDGAVCYLAVDKDRDISATFAGWLDGNIETAFNHDGRSREPPDQHGRTRGQPDGLVYGGALSDGGAFTAGAGLGAHASDGNDPRSREEAMSFIQTETLYNWAPFTDIATEDDSIGPATRTKLLGTSGKAPYGALCQLRFGCEAVLEYLLDLGETSGPVAATRLWPFESSNGKRAVLLSSPDCTQLVYDLHTLGNPAFDPVSGRETLNAAKVALRIEPPTPQCDHVDSLIRVELSALRLDVYGWNDRKRTITPRNVAAVPLAGAMVSAIEPLHRLTLIATSTSLSLHIIDTSETRPIFRVVGSSSDLESEPTAASFFSIAASAAGQPDHVFATVSTASGDVLMYSVTPAQGLVKVFQHRLDPTTPCSSLAAAPLSESPHKTRLLCGMRDGTVRILTFSVSTKRAAFRLDASRSVTVGVTPVSVQTSSDDPCSVLLLCGYRAALMQLPPAPRMEPLIHDIHFMNHAERAYTPGALSAVSFMRESRVAPENLVAATGKAIFSCVLSPTPKALPLRLPVAGSPNRILYSERLRAFFVASTVSHVSETKRYSISTIFMIDTARAPDPKPVPLFQCEPGETITCMLEWKFVKGGSGEARGSRLFHHVVVTTIDTSPSRAKGGSVRFFKVKRDEGTGELKLPFRKSFQEDKPVYSMCQFDNDTLVYCCGDMIKFRKFSAESNRDVRAVLERPRTENPGVYITARKPFIFVSTQYGSFRTYRFDADSGDLAPATADDRARNGLAHNVFPAPPALRGASSGLAIFTDKTASVVGQLQPAAAPPSANGAASMKVLPPSFEAALPVSITRLVQADVRPPWKRTFATPRQAHVVRQHVHVRDVFGTATNGSFWSFHVLSEPAWRLLRFVQHLCLRDARVCPTLAGRPTGFDGHVEPAWRCPRDAHVDGDVLARLVDRRDAPRLLEDMLARTPDVQADEQDFRDAQSRAARFCELVDDVFGDAPAGDGLDLLRPAVGSLSLSDEGGSSSSSSLSSSSSAAAAAGQMERGTGAAVQDALDFARKLVEMPF